MMDMEEVVDAETLVSNLYDEENIQEDVVDDLNYDVFNLVSRNYHSLPATDNLEELLKESITRAAQLLIKKVFECPIEKSEVGPVAVLPSEQTKLPREKPIPEPKPETKWERFAKEKGITKKKRERMVFDDNNDQWAPRYGYKRAKGGDLDLPILEVKHGQDPYADPWELAKEEKKKRIEKNKMHQEKNIERGGVFGKKGGKGSNKLEYGAASVPGIPIDIKGNKNNKNKSALRGKEGLKSALQSVQYSTQSLGRFDEMRKGEPERKMKGKKQAYRDNMDGTSSNEKKIMKAQIRIVADATNKKAKGTKNSIAQYEGILPDAPTNSFKQKKGKVGVRS